MGLLSFKLFISLIVTTSIIFFVIVVFLFLFLFNLHLFYLFLLVVVFLLLLPVSLKLTYCVSFFWTRPSWLAHLSYCRYLNLIRILWKPHFRCFRVKSLILLVRRNVNNVWHVPILRLIIFQEIFELLILKRSPLNILN